MGEGHLNDYSRSFSKRFLDFYSAHPFVFFIPLLVIHVVLLYHGIGELSISGHEAKIVFEQSTLLHYLLQFSLNVFGWDDYGLRLPFLFVHVLNSLLLFQLAKEVLKKPGDAFLAGAVYLLLPGVNSAALLVSKAGFLIFAVLAFIWTFKRFQNYAYGLLAVFVVLDNAFAILYLALFAYGLMKRQLFLGGYALLLFIVSMSLFGFDDGGKPVGHFLDTFGVYTVIFSPFVFVYFFYSLYRTLIREEKNLLWYIVFTALFFSLFLSFRQKIRIEDFAPFFVIGTPLMIRTFYSGYRVRLPQFRRLYNRVTILVLGMLLFNFVLTFVNKPLYHIYENPKRHYAYRYQVARELADELKAQGINHIYSSDRELELRLRFYGIETGERYRVEKYPFWHAEKTVIKYSGIPVAEYYFKHGQ